ncbi:unnamed protein product [Paramecium pentaurelia]|uniref:Uncharacterized protein n=2 Tax=Paramecium pentaurelia TaxID=43138 RepID=A0A8S1WZI7_9CILI|nr:unnamed protein product [Paramecium pentaurelia]
MDPKGQIQQCQILNSHHSSYVDDQEICSRQGSHSNNDSDSSFSLAEQEQECKKLLIQSSNEQEMTKRRRGKHGLKYAKITNDQREGLIKQVTSTGCTIKSAAQLLGINFSTAKAIMQIFKKEGRSCKKVIRKNKKRQSQMFKRHQVVTKDQSLEEENEQKNQIDKIAQQMIQQPISVLEDKNKQQLLIIQQLTNQNLIYQGQVSNIFQENVVLTQNPLVPFFV